MIAGSKNTVVDIRSSHTDKNQKEEYQETWDGYGWAAIVVELVTEKEIFNDEDLFYLLSNDFAELVPPAIYEIALKCLSENPSERQKMLKN